MFSSARHFTALFGATLTSLGAFLAMISVVFRALVAALIADLGAELADLLDELAVAGHITCGQTADCGAVHIQTDTVGHHLDVVFTKTGNGAHVAIVRAAVAGF